MGNINPFIKYGCLREPKFFERVKDIIIYKTINDKFLTAEEYLEQNKESDKKIYYVNDENQQAHYIRMFKENNMDAVILNTLIDSHFISFMEQEYKDVKFMRVDSDIMENMKSDSKDDDEQKKLEEKLDKLFKE